MELAPTVAKRSMAILIDRISFFAIPVFPQKGKRSGKKRDGLANVTILIVITDK